MKRALIIAALVVFSAVSLFPQSLTGKGKIKGTVVDEKTGAGLPGVTVKLFAVKAQNYFRPFPVTDADGKWKALFLRGGSWNIDFEKAGYETKKVSYPVNEVSGAKQVDLDIKMRKIEGIVLTEDIIAQLEKGNVLFVEKKYAEALAAYDSIYAKNPDAFIILKNIGNCHFAMEKYELAAESYLKLFEKQPKSAEVMTLIGNSYSNAQNTEKAMEWYLKIPFEEISDTDTLYNIGANLTNNNKNDQALKYFARAVELDAEFAPGYYQLGMTHTALNQIPEALAALKKFMELAPESPDFGTAKAIVDAFSKVK